MRFLACLLLAACAADPGDTVEFPDDNEDTGPAVEAPCASDLGKAIFAATQDVIARGSVPDNLYSTKRNAADLMALTDGPQIFPAFRQMIGSAEHEVVLQTYVWEPGSDPVNDIMGGIADLARRRAMTAPQGPPVTVRFLFDVLSLGSAWQALPRAQAAFDALAIDPKLVKLELAGFYHFAFGNLHVKTLVVDGRSAIVTGANPQAHHNYDSPWRDAGFRFTGEVAMALLADFDNAWKQGKLWTCGAREDIDPAMCQAAPTPIAYTVLPADLPETTCQPMMLVTRAADANPFSNRIDNTQDQAFLAAFANAKTHIRMQTPNLNDDAAKAALIEAVKRGVLVDIVLSKGFNDSTEVAPGQGGTNFDNVAMLYDALAAAGVADSCRKLRIRWYSRDGLRAVEGNGDYASHEKYASVDDQVVIVGTANMDTQSWNNSRETNVLVDDATVTRAWDSQIFDRDFDNAVLVDQCPTI